MKGQKVFTALYEWMLKEYQRQGATQGKDLTIPVRTVWGWYMRSQGLQNGQRVDESETGHGLMCIVSSAACIRRDVPKTDRLVVMDAEEVHPTFRARAEQWIGSEVVYICDVANHPTDVERVAVCAVPRSFLVKLGVRSEECGAALSEELGVRSEELPDATEISSSIEVTENEDGTINFAVETVAGPRIAEPAPAMTSEKNEGIAEPEPKPKPRAKNAKTPHSSLLTPNCEERSLFDDMLFEFAKHSEATTGYVHRSWWSGEMVTSVKEGDVLTIFYVGVLVVTALAYWIGTVMVEHGATFADFCMLFGLMLAAWAGTMLWVNHKVNVFKKLLGRR